MCIRMTRSLPDLAAWWSKHQPALKRLEEPHLARVIAAKDRRKEQLT